MLGVKSKDVDFAVEAPSFQAMEDHIKKIGLRIFLSKPEFLTIRAGVPVGHPLSERCKDADFVLCRKDGPTLDGRRPQFVEPGTILDDLARRDFTVNAMARDVETGAIIDPHDGRTHLSLRRLSFVGNAMDRIREDGLRVLRALRFSITKGFDIDDPEVFSVEAAGMLHSVSVERVAQEVEKMLRHDTLATLKLLEAAPHIRDVVFRMPKLWLAPSLKDK
jgi:tRNA nucleotidyltransferase/poly(A) polymerase